MSEQIVDHLIHECKRIKDDCEYTAEAQLMVKSSKRMVGFWLKIIPALLAAGSGAAVLLGAQIQLAWLAVISGAVFAYPSIANPDGQANEHTKAAKEFTVLKTWRPILHESFCREMGQTEFYIAVRVLRERYNCIVRYSPKTTDDSFEKAGEKSKQVNMNPIFNNIRPFQQCK